MFSISKSVFSSSTLINTRALLRGIIPPTLMHANRLRDAAYSCRLLIENAWVEPGLSSSRYLSSPIATSTNRGLASSTASGATSASLSSPDLGNSQHVSEQIASWMYRNIKQKNNMSTADYLEFKRKSFLSRLTFWEKFWYGLGSVAAVGLAAARVDWDGTKAAAAKVEDQRRADLELKRLDALPAYMAGKSFAAEEESPFEGATPSDIQALAEKYRRERQQNTPSVASRLKMAIMQDDDPFEGMTPEEIDEYVRRHGGL